MALLTPYWGLDGIIVLMSIMVTAYLYATRKFKYWSKLGIMELTPTPFLGNFTDCLLLKKAPSQFVKSLYDQGKGLPYIGFYIFDKPYFLVRDPEIIKQILVKDFTVFADRYATTDEKNDRLGYANLFMMKNPAWKLLRTKLTPIFTAGKLKRMFELMLLVAKNMEQHIETLLPDGNAKEIEFKDLCANFTTDMIGSTAFGLNVNSLDNPDAPFRQMGRKIFGYNFFRSFEFLVIFFMPGLVKYTRPTFFGKDTAYFFRTVFWDVINERIKSGAKRNDLIDLLIELKKNHENDNTLEGFQFSGDDLVAQAAVFFSGGFETSSTTMSFTLYELALNSDIQNTLRKEIRDALEKTDGKITYEMVMTLPYLDMVISETLRKYPPLGFLDRVSCAKYELPNSNLVLEKDTPIFISMLGMHYDPEYFPDPEKYDPLRFTEEAKQSRPKFVYFPFGEGPRVCIGMRLGLMQSKLGIVQLIKDYEVTPSGKTVTPVVIDPKGLTTTALGGIYLNLRKVNTAAG
ncbi:Cytochrome P450 6k1 [Anthophora retusa]